MIHPVTAAPNGRCKGTLLRANFGMMWHGRRYGGPLTSASDRLPSLSMNVLPISKITALGLSLCVIACGTPLEAEYEESAPRLTGRWVAEPQRTTFSWPEQPGNVLGALEFGITSSAL